MIILGSDKKKIGKTGVSYYVVFFQCSQCKKEWEIERNRAKKRKHTLCKNCYNKSELKKQKVRGKEPKNKQIKCLINCEYCQKPLERSKRHLEKFKHTWCSTSCQNKWQRVHTDFHKGKNNPMYKHGERCDGKLPNYGKSFNKYLKRKVKIRDHFNCQLCKSNFSGNKSKFLDVHHIDQNKFNNDITNLVCLCKVCHTKLHHKLNKED